MNEISKFFLHLIVFNDMRSRFSSSFFYIVPDN